MLSSIKTLFYCLPLNQKKNIYILLLVSFFAAIGEVFSIAAIIPFIAAVTAPDTLFKINFLVHIFDYFEIKSSNDLLIPICIIFSSGALFAGLMRIILLKMSIQVPNKLGIDLSKDLYETILTQPYIEYLSQSSSEILSALTQKVGLIVNLIRSIINALTSFILFLAILIGLLSINPKVAIFAIVGFGTFYLIMVLRTKKTLKSNSVSISKEQTSTVRCIQEGLASMRDIIINNNHHVYVNEYKSNLSKLFKANAENTFIAQSPRFLMEAAAMVAVAIVVIIYSEANYNILEILPFLGALALAAQRCIPIFQTFYSSYSDLMAQSAIINDILKILVKKPDNFDSDSNKKINFKDSIKLKNVTFYYENDAIKILNKVNFKINQGDIVGIVGPTGGGKSTLLDILIGIIQPSQGVVSVDGIILDKSNIKSFQKNISHVPQSVFLKEGTIAENIAFSTPFNEIDLERIKDVSEISQLSSFLKKSEKGLFTQVGERGIKLSGGQRQRIAIARALYKKASIIVFDEATNALDEAIERKIIDAIYKSSKGSTMIFVSHQESSLKFCNKIFRIENSKILDFKS
jgi:ATP-binding cassette, subfamily B, bacterial PglK